jgi:hypothetical protein
LRTLYCQIASAQTPEAHRALQNQAWRLRRSLVATLARVKAAARIKRTGACSKTTSLHRIQSGREVHDGRSIVTHDPDAVAYKVQTAFQTKWGCKGSQGLENLLNAIAKYDGREPAVEHSSIESGFGVLKRWDKLDHECVCVRALYLIFCAVPALFTAWLCALVSTCANMEHLLPVGVVFGKVSAHACTNALRAIIPLSSILSLLDRSLSIDLATKIDRIISKHPGFFVGARPKTQALDVGHAIQLLMEKGADCHGEISVAQVDVRS